MSYLLNSFDGVSFIYNEIGNIPIIRFISIKLEVVNK